MLAKLVYTHSRYLVLIIVSAALKSYDMNQEAAARSLGASRAVAFLTVTLPPIRFSVIVSQQSTGSG